MKSTLDQGTQSAICHYLSELESREGIRVLYAVESGSRAWGFPSPDSDFDVRFIYVRPLEWYLSIQPRRDVLEAMVDPDLDFAGWDLPKALALLRKSNPSLLEWLHSPIVYRQDDAFMTEFRDLARQAVSLRACYQHYVSMAKANYASYFSTEQVRLKKYLYVLRPIFACRFIEMHSAAPPVAFVELLSRADADEVIRAQIDDLLAAKAKTSEMGEAPRRPVLDRFIEGELTRSHSVTIESRPPADYELFDRFLRSILGSMATGTF